MRSAEPPGRASAKFQFRNLGPIKEAELELGELTIVAGRNNTGKTYLTYALYGFLRACNTWPHAERYLHAGRPFTAAADLISETVAQGYARRRVDRAALCVERGELLGRLTRDFSGGALAGVFSSPEEALEDASVGVKVCGGFPEARSTEIDLQGGRVFSVAYDGAEVVMAGSDRERDRSDASWLSLLYLRFLLQDLFSDPFILSAERFGISLFYKELDFTKNKLVDLLQRMGDDRNREALSPFALIESATGRYALPIKDNIDYTRDLSNIQRTRSDIYGNKLFDGIKEMMEGYFRSSDDEVRFVSKARKERRFSIPLHRASSSARGLSDLYFFLRHAAKEDQIVIIDEPESHLDTANQIRLARLLARMVRAGLKVLVTTHSDYLIKEVNNLIMLSKQFEDRGKIAKRLKYKEDDFLRAESVRAYVAENGTLTRCTIDEFGIEMPFFDRTIDDINRVSNELATILARDGGA